MKKNGQYVGVDEKYIPEEEKYVDNSTNEEIKGMVNDGLRAAKNYISDKDNQEKIKNAGRKGWKIFKGIGIGYLAFLGFVVLLAITIVIITFVTFFKVNNSSNDISNEAETIIDNMTNLIDDNKNSGATIDEYSDVEIKIFNSPFELYEGSKSGFFVNELLQKIVTNNKTEKDHIITVSYNSITTFIVDDITALKDNFENSEYYEVSFDYDANGFINKVIIK